MSSRFEKIIAGGVVLGAISLAGCASSGNGGKSNTGTDPDPVPTLESARTLNSTQIELTFSEAVSIANSGTAPGLFTLTTTQWNPSGGFVYGGSYAGSPCYKIPYGYYVNCTIGEIISSYGAGSPVSISSVASVSGEPARLTLALGTAIQDADDGGTGLLRLSYTAGDGGVADSAGNGMADLVLGANDRGNVLDGVGPPQLIEGRTISATEVELVFSEPIQATDANATAAGFRISNSKFSYFDGVTPNSFSSVYYSWSQFQFGTAGAIPSTDPRAFRFTISPGSPIQPDWDNGRGLLRVHYTAPAGGIEDLEGNPLASFNLNGVKRRGNVVDTVE